MGGREDGGVFTVYTHEVSGLAMRRLGRPDCQTAPAAASRRGDAAGRPDPNRAWTWAGFELRRRGGAAVTRDLVRRLQAAEAATARPVRSAAAEERVEAAIRAVPDEIKWRWLRLCDRRDQESEAAVVAALAADPELLEAIERVMAA